ncbi:hypothetical protein BN873_330090 [Candidatus Competibacter denitrificans Run_A_D11]|uniref:Uncharacterized protein n=1 Tax=Candidatus Competibacter denitrificans Run_A_D11 TaxID=1400863 RepID=W6MDA8_9GAMM|nr:hypothetical protein BN873_330090 [Candidatus Competibacter denitrificans Run_A_D11]
MAITTAAYSVLPVFAFLESTKDLEHSHHTLEETRGARNLSCSSAEYAPTPPQSGKPARHQ